MPRKIYTFQWYHHPDKDQAWFDQEKERLAPDAFAREILISYTFSAASIVFTEFCQEHIQEGDYQFNPDLPVYRAVDFGRTCAALWAQKDSHGRFTFFKELILEPSSTTELADAVQKASYELQSHVDLPRDVCDPAGNTVSYTAGFSDIKILNEFGIYPHFDKLQASSSRLQDGITLIKHLLSQRNAKAGANFRINRKGCPTLIEAFQAGYRYKVNRSTGETLDVVDERHPYEDVMDCLRYTIMQYGHHEIKKKPFVAGVTKFTPTKTHPNYKPRMR